MISRTQGFSLLFISKSVSRKNVSIICIGICEIRRYCSFGKGQFICTGIWTETIDLSMSHMQIWSVWKKYQNSVLRYAAALKYLSRCRKIMSLSNLFKYRQVLLKKKKKKIGKRLGVGDGRWGRLKEREKMSHSTHNAQQILEGRGEESGSKFMLNNYRCYPTTFNKNMCKKTKQKETSTTNQYL